ncbi:hypothetical protein GA0115243_101291 [Streptomyces sp. ScaeMP-e83]|nr:hypothetical protein GA0115243_101291 [Streptomyces sp. ScaeMP-e83]
MVAYFDAINDQDHRAAWELGGKNLAGDYRAFVDGLAGTERGTVRILGVEGNTVRAELEALQTDGSLKVFEGSYTVRSGVIMAADVREVTGAEGGLRQATSRGCRRLRPTRTAMRTGCRSRASVPVETRVRGSSRPGR